MGEVPEACALGWDSSVTLYPCSIKPTQEGAGQKEKLAACSQDSASDPWVCGIASASGWHWIWGPGAERITPLKTPLGPPHRHSYQTCFSSLLISFSSHVSQVTAALLSDGLSASSMKPDSYKGWISSKRIFIRKKKPSFYSLVLLCGVCHILPG